MRTYHMHYLDGRVYRPWQVQALTADAAAEACKAQFGVYPVWEGGGMGAGLSR